MKKDSITLKGVFIRYLLCLLVVLFFIVVVLSIAFIEIGIKTEFLYPANHVENLIRQVKPTLESATEIKENMIPEGCKFVTFDKKFNVTKTNMNEKSLAQATLYAKGNSLKDLGTKRYYFIEREDGVCILQYYIRASYSSDWLNEHFPAPQFFTIIIIVLGCIISTIFVTVIYAKKLKNHLVPLMEATYKIKEQNLNFDVGKSKIKEFNDVLLSLSEMKTELKESLKKQWNLEQVRREQISALAHDIKTPLTIVKGNTELLCDTNLDEEQKIYSQFILKNANQIEEYIILLNKISKAESKISFSPKKYNLESFIEEVERELTALANPKEIKIQCVKKNIPKEIIIDRELFFRCIMNIVSNGVEYTPKEGLIEFNIIGGDKSISFIIIDGGKGFTKEALKSAKKQFFMGDTSRSSKKHFGMGLYIADSIAKIHEGKLTLENSLNRGGKVTIEIPFKV